MSLLASLRDEAKIMELSRLGTKHVHEVHSIVDEIARFAGDAAIGALAKFPDDGGGTGEIPTDLAKAIASIGSRRAAEALATRLDDKAVRPVALASSRRGSISPSPPWRARSCHAGTLPRRRDAR